MSLEDLLEFDGSVHVADIGAAAIAEIPPYKILLDHKLARLSAVDGDERQRERLIEAYGAETRVYSQIIADGRTHRLHLASPASGMSSILAPSDPHLAFFNGFSQFGKIEKTMEVRTSRLADVEGLQQIDYLKMDIQGAELMVLENAGKALDECVAIQLEASFIPLYEGQPGFGDVDVWMRRAGYLPHCFAAVKRWSIFPTIRNRNFRTPFNQLLECDIVYVRGLVDLSGLSDDQLKKIALISAYCYNSPDLCVHAVRELERRRVLPQGRFKQALALFRTGRKGRDVPPA